MRQNQLMGSKQAPKKIMQAPAGRIDEITSPLPKSDHAKRPKTMAREKKASPATH
jgi:hypothetical protein